MKKTVRAVLSLILVLVFVAGCGKSVVPTASNTDKPETKMEPTTVKIAASNVMFPEEDFMKYITEPVKKKYPQITIERINTSVKGNSIVELLTAGIVPDIVTYYPGSMGSLNDLGLTYNIEELIKKYKFDLNRIAPGVMDTIKIASNQSYIVGLPSYNTTFGLFYNKDVFDRFGVPYPKDGMTWDQVRDISVKLTRMDNGVQYRGLYADALARGSRQLSLSAVDFTTNKSLLSTEPWNQLFQYWYNMFNIPGLMDGDYKKIVGGVNEGSFSKGELAMLAGLGGMVNGLVKTPGVNWDVVSYPTNPKAPGIGQRVDGPVLNITSQSKNKDAAFLVLETVLSDEVQMSMSLDTRMSLLKDQKINDAFGKGIPELKGKNMTAFSKDKLAVIAPFKFLNETEIDKITGAAFQSVIDKQKDINTALRDADEALNKYIDTLKK